MTQFRLLFNNVDFKWNYEYTCCKPNLVISSCRNVVLNYVQVTFSLEDMAKKEVACAIDEYVNAFHLYAYDTEIYNYFTYSYRCCSPAVDDGCANGGFCPSAVGEN